MIEAYNILKFPDIRLLTKASDVEENEFNTPWLVEIVDRMFETIRHKGIGLAATQVDIHKKIIVIDIDDKKHVIINPMIIVESQTLASSMEGCLSVPKVYGEVYRPESIRIKYQNIKGDILYMDADGLLATCIQHEIDHLNGIVYVERMTRLKRSMLLKKYEKINKY